MVLVNLAGSVSAQSGDPWTAKDLMDPELLVYDEPFAGLDPIALGMVLRLIRRLNDAGQTLKLLKKVISFSWVFTACKATKLLIWKNAQF